MNSAFDWDSLLFLALFDWSTPDEDDDNAAAPAAGLLCVGVGFEHEDTNEKQEDEVVEQAEFDEPLGVNMKNLVT